METLSENIKGGFRGTGIIPLDRNQVLKRLPKEGNVEDGGDPNAWTAAVVDLLSESRNSCKPTLTKKKKVTVEPGKSLSRNDFPEAGPSTSHLEEEMEVEVNSELEVSEGSTSEQESVVEDIDDSEEIALENLSVNDFIEVQFEAKVNKYFVGQIKEIGEDIEVKFLRPNRKKKNCFVFPAVDDTSAINLGQIIKKLPNPNILRRGGYEFPIKMKLKSYAI